MSEEHKFYLSAALSLMAERPENIPVFLWKDENEVIGAISNQMAIRVPREEADLYKKEAGEIIPLDSSIMGRRIPSFDKSVKGTKRLPYIKSGMGISLCSKIGQNREGSYITTLLDCPAVKTVRFTHLVGGQDCWGRCGGGCHPGFGDVIGTKSHNYTQACHDHDHCVTYLYAAAPTCMGIFTAYCTPDKLREDLRCDKDPYKFDFKISSVVINPTTVKAGTKTSITINSELQNIVSFGPYAAKLVKIYLGDRLLGSCDLKSTLGLGVWGTFKCSGSLVIPPDASGNYVVKVSIAEFATRGAVQDRNIGNNIWTGSITVTPPPRPDLVVTSVTGPTSGTAGGSIEGIKVTVKNQGTTASTVNVPARILLSTDNTITLSDTSTQIDCQYPPLTVGQSFTCSVPSLVRIPENLVSGTYYLGAYVDPVNQVAESNESNNGGAAVISITAGPDLVVTSVTGPTHGTAGSRIEGMITVTITNQGMAASRFNAYAGIILSTDQTITLSDIYQGSGTCQFPPLAVGQSFTCSVPASQFIPENRNGTYYYYFGAYADTLNQVVESNESNNGGAAAAAITITGGGTGNNIPQQLSPLDGTAFSHYPRTTTVQWTSVTNAQSYKVEVEYFEVVDLGGLTFTRQVPLREGGFSGITTNSFTFDFVGSQTGKWRVSAVINGIETPSSSWWHFYYTR